MSKQFGPLEGKDIILKMKKDTNAGLGHIFRELSSRNFLEGLGSYIIFKRIILTLSEAGYSIPRQSIVRHFNECVPTEDYAQEEKEALLKDLRIASRLKSTPIENFKPIKMTLEER